MLMKEMIQIFKTKLSLVILMFLLFASFTTMVTVMKDTTKVQTYSDFMASLKQVESMESSLLENSKREYEEAVHLSLQKDIKAKGMRMALMKQQYEEFTMTEAKLSQLDEADSDQINRIWSVYLIRRQIRMASFYGTDTYHDLDPVMVFQNEIQRDPKAFSHIIDPVFDYEFYTSMNYVYGTHDTLAKHHEYESQISMLRSSFYSYEHEVPLAIFDQRGPELYHSLLFQNNSLFGVGSLLCALLFFFLNAQQFHSLRMDQYYAALPVSRSQLFAHRFFNSTAAFMILYLVAYFLPFLFLVIRFGFHWLNYPALMDADILTSYQGATNRLYDGVYGFLPYVSTNPGPDLPFYPSMSISLQVISYGMVLLLTLLFQCIQIIAINSLIAFLTLFIRKRMLMGSISLLLMLTALTRVRFVGGLSVIPIWAPSAIYLMQAGHGVGIGIYLILSLIWIVGFLLLGNKQMQRIDLMEE